MPLIRGVIGELLEYFHAQADSLIVKRHIRDEPERIDRVPFSRLLCGDGLAPPSRVRSLTQANEFMSMITVFRPLTGRAEPSSALDSSREYESSWFAYVKPGSGVMPDPVAVMPSGYTPRLCAEVASGMASAHPHANSPAIVRSLGTTSWRCSSR